MTNELAAIPQPILREVALRLINAEDSLSRSPEAIDFLGRYGAQPTLLDEIADLFLSAAETPPVWAHLVNYRALALGYGEVLYAYQVAVLGASRSTLERTMIQLVRCGYWQQAEELAHRLDRELTRDEVLDLIRSYTGGGIYGQATDQLWLDFAERLLDSPDAQTVRSWIRKRNASYAQRLL